MNGRNGNILKSYICRGVKVDLLYSKKMNCYIIEIENQIAKIFSVQTTMKEMEAYAMQTLTRLTNNK